MSEPSSAFVRLHIGRADLVRWLEAPPPDPAHWTDWRDLGGRWCLDGDVDELAEAPADEVERYVDDAGGLLRPWPSVRAAFRGLLGDDEAASARRITYDPETREFIAGSLLYAENLILFLAFLALVRGAEDVLGAGDGGIAVIHDYVFSSGDSEATVAVMEIGPGRASRLLGESARASAVAVFQGLADVILADPDELPPPVDHLDDLR